jgi:NAD(P)-dependent dehydrogenase (short-subunit alcohol dehydrogenase family)
MSKYLNKFSLIDKSIVVTGACGLLGREICKSLAELKANIVITDVDINAGQELEKLLQKDYQAFAQFHYLDITSEQSINNLIMQLEESAIPIYGLVNNAYPRNADYGTIFENILLDSWRENVDMHLNGYFNVSQKVARVMIKQNFGNIVNMSSIYGLLGPDFRIYEGTPMTMPAEYAAIKGGIINLTRYLATYLAKYHIRVNSISAGGIFDGQPASFVEKYCQRTPVGRMGNPENIAGGVVFLMTELSEYITGHNLVIDGGWSAW